MKDLVRSFFTGLVISSFALGLSVFSISTSSQAWAGDTQEEETTKDETKDDGTTPGGVLFYAAGSEDTQEETTKDETQEDGTTPGGLSY